MIMVILSMPLLCSMAFFNNSNSCSSLTLDGHQVTQYSLESAGQIDQLSTDLCKTERDVLPLQADIKPGENTGLSD